MGLFELALSMFDNNPQGMETVWVVANRIDGTKIDVLPVFKRTDGSIEEPPLQDHRMLVGIAYVQQQITF